MIDFAVSPLVVVGPNTDYREIEKRVLAAMLLHGEVLIDFESPGGDIAGNPLFALPELQPLVLAEPVKQNGRSAAYLRHDPSKKYGRNKR